MAELGDVNHRFLSTQSQMIRISDAIDLRVTIALHGLAALARIAP